MPRPRIAMRYVRDILRLGWDQGLSRREIGRSLGIPFTTVSDHVHRAEVAGLTWPLPDGLDDAALEALLFRNELPSLQRAVAVGRRSCRVGGFVVHGAQHLAVVMASTRVVPGFDPFEDGLGELATRTTAWVQKTDPVGLREPGAPTLVLATRVDLVVTVTTKSGLLEES